MTQVTGIATWLAPRVNLPPFAFTDAGCSNREARLSHVEARGAARINVAATVQSTEPAKPLKRGREHSYPSDDFQSSY